MTLITKNLTPIWALLCIFLLTTTKGSSQCAILPTAIAGITCDFTSTNSSHNSTGIAYNPNLDLYYASIAGNSSMPLETFDQNGNSIFQTNTGFDTRGLWWNSSLNQLESNGYSTGGIQRIDLDVHGNATNQGTNIFYGFNQPHQQSCGTLDQCSNEVIYYHSGEIVTYDRTNNTQIGSYSLIGMPATFSNILEYAVAYTGCLGMEIALLDHQNKKIYFFDKSTGEYSGQSEIPASFTFPQYFGFSYTNNLAWIFDINNSSWRSFKVLDKPNESTFNLGNDTTFCQGQTPTLDATFAGATAYLWSTNATESSIIISDSGEYSVMVTTACSIFYDTIAIQYISNIPSIDLGDDTTICLGETLSLDASTTSATSYLWNTTTNTPTINIDSRGEYSVTASNKCFSITDTIVVSVNSISPKLDLGNDTSLCVGQILSLDISQQGFNYKWNTLSTDSILSIAEAGIYWAEISNLCTRVTDTIHVSFDNNEFPILDLGETQTICPEQTVVLDGYSEHATNYLWSTSSTNASIDITQPGTYWIKASNACNTFTDTIHINACDILVYIPSAFTPNNDGHNDTFFPVSNCNLSNYSLSITNKWGQELFSTNDENAFWDGKYQGNICQNDVYVYLVEYTTDTNIHHKKMGKFKLLK